MASLVPRDANGPSGWQPAILDDPAAAKGISKVWEQWLKERLPKLLPEAEGRSVDWSDDRRLLWESRQLVAAGNIPRGSLPDRTRVAGALKALIPRRYSGTPGWNPAILDDPDAAEGISKVWELACQNAER